MKTWDDFAALLTARGLTAGVDGQSLAYPVSVYSSAPLGTIAAFVTVVDYSRGRSFTIRPPHALCSRPAVRSRALEAKLYANGPLAWRGKASGLWAECEARRGLTLRSTVEGAAVTGFDSKHMPIVCSTKETP